VPIRLRTSCTLTVFCDISFTLAEDVFDRLAALGGDFAGVLIFQTIVARTML
jgi:hypothetical protein